MVPVDSFIKNVLKILIKENISIFFSFPKLVILWNKIPWILLILGVVSQKDIYTWRGSCNGLTCWRAGNAASRFSKFKSDFRGWHRSASPTTRVSCALYWRSAWCFSQLGLLARHGIDWTADSRRSFPSVFQSWHQGWPRDSPLLVPRLCPHEVQGMRGVWGPFYKDPNDSSTSRLLYHHLWVLGFQHICFIGRTYTFRPQWLGTK